MASDSLKQTNSITKFEFMSDELLMELFEYYDLYSLYYSFGLLNSRIDHIIYHCQVCANFDKVKQDDFIDFLCHILPKFNPKNIKSLYASRSYQIEVLAYDKSLIYFTYIRSLCLRDIRKDTMIHILSRLEFSHLERVVLNKHSQHCSYSSPISDQFFDSNRFPLLQTYKDSGREIGKGTSVVLVKYVTLYTRLNPNDFLNFLNQSPCLKYIKASLIFNFDYSQPIYLSPIPYHNTLKRLNLNLAYTVCMKTVVYLLECVPELCHLKLKIDSWANPPLSNPMFWETVLSNHLVKLKGLSLKSKVKDFTSSPDPIWEFLMNQEKVNEQIQTSNYWSSHQWNVTFTSNMITTHLGNYRREAEFQVK